MSIKLTDLQEDVRFKASKAIAILLKANIPYVVTYTLRTKQEQYALWCQGRKTLSEVNIERKKAGLYLLIDRENKQTVTNCNGTTKADGGTGISAHQTGRALDVVPLENGRAIWPALTDLRWELIAKAFREQGFECGKDWKDFPDYPHYQLA
jgi:peptidoglycan L-alanyl-D-glutamate endopeptidase CwlK